MEYLRAGIENENPLWFNEAISFSRAKENHGRIVGAMGVSRRGRLGRRFARANWFRFSVIGSQPFYR